MCDSLVFKGGSCQRLYPYSDAAGTGEDTSTAPGAQVQPSGLLNQGRIEYYTFHLACRCLGTVPSLYIESL